MLSSRDSFTRLCAACLFSVFAGNMSLADGSAPDLATWVKTFEMYGAAAGRYSACTHRDMTTEIARNASSTASSFVNRWDSKTHTKPDEQTTMLLDDTGRTYYFQTLSERCDPTNLEALRKDLQLWEDTITKALILP